MEAETSAPIRANELEAEEETPEERIDRRFELLSAGVMAVATILTAWSAYQSSRWNSASNLHQLRVVSAIVNQSKFANLAEQRRSLDISLFGQWVIATNSGDSRLADFVFRRFPEPLRTATEAWRARDPLNDPEAPTSPFVMPEYSLKESAEETHWAENAVAESASAERAGALSDRYLLFTVIFATTLFFAGISGKFGSYWINAFLLIFGALTLAISAAILFTLPVT